MSTAACMSDDALQTGSDLRFAFPSSAGPLSPSDLHGEAAVVSSGRSERTCGRKQRKERGGCGRLRRDGVRDKGGGPHTWLGRTGDVDCLHSVYRLNH